MQLPTLDIVAPRVVGKALIYAVNIDELPSVAIQFKEGNSIPILVLLQDGSEVKRFDEVQSESKIIEAIEEVLPVELRRKRIPHAF